MVETGPTEKLMLGPSAEGAEGAGLGKSQAALTMQNTAPATHVELAVLTARVQRVKRGVPGSALRGSVVTCLIFGSSHDPRVLDPALHQAP